MKKIKKLMAVILALIMLQSIVFADGIISFENTVVDTVKNLGLMPYTDFSDMSVNLTRSQMVESTLKIMGIDANVYPEPESYIFEDVDYSVPDSKNIIVAHSLGLINGVSETEFAPDSEATLAQAVKVLVSAMGYEVKAVNMGDYSAGYLAVASQTGLLRGIKLENTGALSQFTFAKLLYNALDTETFERVVYGSEESYVRGAETPLSKYLGYQKIKGVITEFGDVNLYGNQPSAPKDHVYVGSTLFKCADESILDFIGYSANVYFKESDTGSYPEISFFMTEQYNNTLKLSCDDIISISHSASTINISYEVEEANPVNLSVTSAAFLYNGYPVEQSDISSRVITKLLADENYSIELIDNNLDKSYEVIAVKQYNAGIIKRVNPYHDVIYCYNFSDMASFSPIYLNPADEKEKPYKIFGEDGKETEISSIMPDGAVAVYENLDGTYRKIYISSKTVSGKVTEVSNGEYLIDAKAYKVSKDYTENNLGVTAEFFLDIEGKIIGRKNAELSRGAYGLLMNVYVGSGRGISNYPELRILTAEGDMKDFYAENQITAYNPHTSRVEKTNFTSLVNTSQTPEGYGGIYDYMIWHTQNELNFTFDTRQNDYTEQFYWRPWLTEKDMSDIASRKPIYYETNKDGRISKILVPDIPTAENKITLLNDNGSYTFTYNSSQKTALEYSPTSDRLPYYKFASDAIIFSVLALDYTEKDYSVPVQGLSIMPNNAERKMKLYSISGGSEAEMAVVYSHLPYENLGNMPYVVVDYVTKTADGKTKLYGFSHGQRYEAVIKEETRLVEKIPNSSNTEYNSSTKVTAGNILDFRGYDAGGSGRAPYNIATSTSPELLSNSALKIGVNTPYADETSLKRGDIIIVGKNRGEEICYVEMAMRADTCIMLIPNTQDEWYSRLNNSSAYFKGVVTDLTGYDEVCLRVIGEYSNAIRRKTTEKPDFRQSAYFDDKKVPYDFTMCKYVWSYDYKRNTIEVISPYAIDVGDVIVGRGGGTAPKDCIVLKNYPAEPDFSYWQNN